MPLCSHVNAGYVEMAWMHQADMLDAFNGTFFKILYVQHYGWETNFQPDYTLWLAVELKQTTSKTPNRSHYSSESLMTRYQTITVYSQILNIESYGQQSASLLLIVKGEILYTMPVLSELIKYVIHKIL